MPESDVVRVEFRKWTGASHWRYAMRRLGEDEHGVWLWAPAGTEAHRGDGPATPFAANAVTLLPRDAWWTAIWNDEGGHRYDLYVDVVTPPRWEDGAVTMVDLDLDIARDRTGAVRLLDEDEFEARRRSLGYPDHVVDQARTTAAAVFLSVSAGEEPFSAVGAAWLDAARSVAGS